MSLRRRTSRSLDGTRWTLPGELARLGEGEPDRYRRTARDWAVDLALFGAASLYWLSEQDGREPYYLADQPDWMGTVDPWVGALACLALWARRRFPLGLVWAMVPMLWFSGTATGAVLVAIFTVAVHRGWRTAAVSTAPYVAMGLWFAYEFPDPSMSRLGTMLLLVLMFLTPLAWGIAIRSRRQLVVGLHRDAERERREHAFRLGAARHDERERIAREMHDTLAHRISLLSVHAGALAYRTRQAETGDAPPLATAEVGEAVTVILDNAKQALDELGEVLTVLRSGDPDADVAPQPRLAGVVRLVEEAVAAGQRVRFEPGTVVDVADSVRPQAQRTAYRVVQEGLTNARKHAPGTDVEVRLAGEPGGELEVTVANPLPAWAGSAELPGAEVGLTGLAERIAVDGGTLEHGARNGRFRLHARLPWPDDRTGERSDPGSARR